MMIFSRLSAAVLGGLLSIPSLHAATAARCNAGDLAGKWSHYASIYSPDSHSVTLRCSVILSNGTGADARKYNITGTCKSYSTNSPTPADLRVAGSLSLVETSTCKLQGAYAIGQSFPFPVDILDARIEGGSPKQRITGISRIPAGSNMYQLLRFRFQR
jgi:hypothetical protein